MTKHNQKKASKR